MKFWLLMSAVAGLDILGISLGKVYITSHKLWIFAVAVICYALMGVLLILALNYKTLAITNVIWGALTIAIITAISILYFKEPLTTLQGIGIFLVLIGVVLVNK